MCYYKNQTYIQKGYASDLTDAWFGGEKPNLAKSNSCINLPYIIDGDEVITQSNTCLLYLGKKLAIDSEDAFFHNHTVLDQTMDLRNDLMTIVYPFAGKVKSKDDFPDEAKKHIEKAKGHFATLEGCCRGTNMCGAEPQSGDFALFEMIDEHVSICKSLGIDNVIAGFPKLAALHAAMLAEPSLAKYFASDAYAKWSQNNPLATFYTGFEGEFEYGQTETTTVTM
jgi:glutathione S-transferase